jgi:uncharacterized lipoprotein YajG
MKKLGLALTVMVMLATAGGCAFTKDYLTLQYVPEANARKHPGAETISVNVSVVDERRLDAKPPNQVSCKKNGFGMEMAQILAKNDVMSVVREAFATELRNRGFKIGNGGAKLNVKVVAFWNDFKMGAWSGSAVGEVIVTAQVEGPMSNIVHIQSVTGRFTEKGIQLASGANAKIALDGALQDAVLQVMKKVEFFNALVQSGTPATAPAPIATGVVPPPSS